MTRRTKRALRLAQIRRSNEGLASRLETLLRQRTATERDGFLAKIELVRGQPEEARRKTEQVVTAFPDPQRAGGVLANALQLRAEALDRLDERVAALADIQTALAIAYRLQGGRAHSLRAGQSATPAMSPVRAPLPHKRKST